jgi:hypothetical protein
MEILPRTLGVQFQDSVFRRRGLGSTTPVTWLGSVIFCTVAGVIQSKVRGIGCGGDSGHPWRGKACNKTG